MPETSAPTDPHLRHAPAAAEVGEVHRLLATAQELVEHAHDALGGLEHDLEPILADPAPAPGDPTDQAPAVTPLGGRLSHQGAALSMLLRRIEELRQRIDL